MVKKSRQQSELDKQKILLELQKNAKQSIQSIAKKCGFSRQKIQHAIKEMEENHTIWGYTAIVDQQKQGLRKYILSIKRSSKQMDKATLQRLISYRFSEDPLKIGIIIENCYYVHGEYDWVITFIAKDIRHAKQFTSLLFQAYEGLIERFNLTEVLKITYSQHVLCPDAIDLEELL